MQLEELEALMTQSSDKFNELKVEEGIVKNRLETIDTSLKRLQGEHEAYQKLQKSLLERTPQSLNATGGDPATVTPDPFKGRPKGRVENAAS